MGRIKGVGLKACGTARLRFASWQSSAPMAAADYGSKGVDDIRGSRERLSPSPGDVPKQRRATSPSSLMTGSNAPGIMSVSVMTSPMSAASLMALLPRTPSPISISSPNIINVAPAKTPRSGLNFLFKFDVVYDIEVRMSLLWECQQDSDIEVIT